LSQRHKKELQALLIVSPVGAYLGRVKNGIGYALNLHGNRNADIQLRLIVSEEYSKADPNYEREFVDTLSEWIEQYWKKSYPQMTVGRRYLPVKDRNRCKYWLIEQLCLFFREKRKDSLACVDLTSAPREWFFAAMDICPFFDRVQLYNVPPATRSVPSDFLKDEREDPGTIVEDVMSGSLTLPLKYWLHSVDEQGIPTEHHVLFRTLWELATRKEQPYRSDEVSDKFKTNCLKAYCDALDRVKGWADTTKKPEMLRELSKRKKKLEAMERGGIKKKTSRYFSDIKTYQLFTEVQGKYELTETGMTLAKVMFASDTSAQVTAE